MALTKRGRREGSIYRMPDGRWRGEVVLGRRPDGKRDRRVVYGESRQEVAEKLATLIADARAGKLPAYDPTSLAAYLDGWLEQRRTMGVIRPNTYKQQEMLIRRYVRPTLGAKPLQRVTPADLEDLYRQIVTVHGRSIRTAELVHRTLYTAFEAAVTKGLLAVNPAARVPNPPRVRYRAADRPRLPRERVPEVLAAVRETRYYLPLLVAMTAGLRMGEVLGLTWEHVDLESGILRIRQQWNLAEVGPPGPDGKRHREWGLVPVKSEAGNRDVPIPPETVDALAAHLVAQRAQMGERWTPQALVFDRGDGKPIRHGDVHRTWQSVCERLGLPDGLRLHDLRGSYITWLAEQKVDPKAVAEVVGHSDVRITFEIYQSVTTRMRHELAGALRGIARLPDAGSSEHASGGSSGGNSSRADGVGERAESAS